MTDAKTCSKCGEHKPLNDFPKNGRGGHRAGCKACHCAYVKARYHADIDAARERRREQTRKDYARDPEKFKARAQAWRELNPDKHLEISARWARANPDKAREYKRKWDDANPDKKRDYVRRRRARRKNAEASPYTEHEIFQRDNGTCRNCRQHLDSSDRRSWEIDHIVPISLGGGDTPANVQLLCRPCNRTKGASLKGQIHLPV